MPEINVLTQTLRTISVDADGQVSIHYQKKDGKPDITITKQHATYYEHLNLTYKEIEELGHLITSFKNAYKEKIEGAK